MNLRLTILGLLSWKPSSGYDLKRIIGDSAIFYWSGNNNQVYKNLIELRKEGLVTYQVQVQESLPAKKIYSITDEGLSELHQGLLATPEVPELHKDCLIQLSWAELLSNEEILDVCEKYKVEIEDRLQMYRFQASRPGNNPNRSKREEYLWKSIAENLVVSCQTELTWLCQIQQALRDVNYQVNPDRKMK
jgi:PadR family transcriptional regulator, regulatory protein AphA